MGYINYMIDTSPCVRPGARIWSFRRGRYLVGKEMLALQGFPVDSFDFRCLAESDARVFAGNAMSVPVVGAFLSMVLALVAFPEEGDSECELGGPAAVPQQVTSQASDEAADDNPACSDGKHGLQDEDASADPA